MSLYGQSLEFFEDPHLSSSEGVANQPDVTPTKSQYYENCKLVVVPQHFNNVTMTANSSKNNHHHHHQPIWVPSYPGSGSELFRKIIVALTGGMLDGGNWYDDQCVNYPATCKTHCPFLQKETCPTSRAQGRRGRLYDNDLNNGDPKQQKKKRIKLQHHGAAPAADNHNPNGDNNADKYYYHSSAILLIRNPRDAIASYINWRWENRRSVETHTQQAPKEFWMQQRNEEFTKLLGGWRQLILWWTAFGLRQSIYNVSLIIPYEQFINDESGPNLLHQLANELQRANIPVLVSKDQFPCLWYQIVKAPKSSTKRVGHKYIPSYTELQKQIMIQKLNDLITTFSSSSTPSSTPSTSSNNNNNNNNIPPREDLVTILTRYREDIISNLPIDEG